ncbi:hypothetical protein [Enterovibrio baiacu]|uniref:hypothetical protein n=1 Tax=Enterovibrio baiacu TaxID=2491023 RepID=UPI00101292FC|nr:hypothetical protein [Enterovibrio baiacu]MBE1277701.1 hypothetical protein [Enterovibrio baiacu]
MEVELILNKVSKALDKISVESRVNAYNLLAQRANKPQFSVSFNESFNLETLSASSLEDHVVLKEEDYSIDELLLNAIDLSSQQGKLISVTNARLQLERMVIKGSA